MDSKEFVQLNESELVETNGGLLAEVILLVVASLVFGGCGYFLGRKDGKEEAKLEIRQLNAELTPHPTPTPTPVPTY